MIKDIDRPDVEGIAVAVVPDFNELNEPEWNVYLINLKEQPITNIIVASKGYGNKDGEHVKTSTLRHFWEKLDSKSFIKIEMITDSLLTISNEFWLSFYIENTIYDKKYVFLAESIQEENFVEVPIIGKKGVMIK